MKGPTTRYFIALLLLAEFCTWRIVQAAPANTNWGLLGNSEEMQGHSDLDQINTRTVSRLGLAWSIDLPTPDGLVGNPLIEDGVVFQSGSLDRVYANDLKTGRSLWVYDPEVKRTEFHTYWGSRTNRGLALWGSLAIVGTSDCRLIAVEQKTGRKVWETQACESAQNYTITGAPRVGDGLVFIGNSCNEDRHDRGYVDAYDARTGLKRWRFYTVPGDPSKPQENAVYRLALKSWGKGWYEKTKGCGGPYDAMTYDPQLHQLYIGTNMSGVFNPAARGEGAGDELFTNSIVAIDTRTGEYVWHFKQDPNEGWDFESTFGIMIATLPIEGQERRVVISVPKDGFLYVLDAKTGKFLSGRNYVPVNWAKGLDAKGRPIVNPAAEYWKQASGTAVVWPSPQGGHNFEALAYSPIDHLLYIPAVGAAAVLARSGPSIQSDAKYFMYYGSDQPPPFEAYGEVVAWDPVTQQVRWRQPELKHFVGGLLHTSGDLVFGGDGEGYLTAYDARTGQVRWKYPAGGAIYAEPSTVMLDGEQYLVVPSGNGGSSIGNLGEAHYASSARARSRPRLLAFKLGGQAPAPAWASVPQVPRPSVPRFDRALAHQGWQLAEESSCVLCHGLGFESAGGAVLDLRILQPSLDLMNDVVRGGTLKSAGMPQFESLSPADIEALHAYIINRAWEDYEAQAKVTPPDAPVESTP
jgi:quinohemoprotein ethanol dehydrogenase